MAKERPVTAGGATADPRSRDAAAPHPHAGRTPPSPVAPGPRRPATGGPTDPRPIASPFLTDPAGAPPATDAPSPAASPAVETPPLATPPGAASPAADAPPPAASPAAEAPSQSAPPGAASPAAAAPEATAPPAGAAPHAAAPPLADAPPSTAAGSPTAAVSPARSAAAGTVETPVIPATPQTPSDTPAQPQHPARPQNLDQATEAARRPAPHPPAVEGRTTERRPVEGRPAERAAPKRPDLPSSPDPVPADQRDAPSRGVAKVPAARPPWPGLQLQPMVHVADMPAAVAFYEKLGGDLIHGDRDGAWVLMQVGTSQIGLVTRPPNPARGESTVELNFSATMPLDRLERLLREREVRIVRMAADPDLGIRLHVETPDGMPIKIHQVEPDLLI